METVKLLKKEFTGRGEVKGFYFRQVYMHDKFYVYEVTDETDGIKDFMILTCKTEAKSVITAALDRYTNVSFDRSGLQESYPSSKMFGIKGWTYPSKERTIEGVKAKFKTEIIL